MVVNVMSLKTHASIKALSGYCAFQRLMLMFAQQYPALRTHANYVVDRFVEDEKYRTKKVVPALGEFLPLLSLTDKRWPDIALIYMQEHFDRNAYWILRKRPELADISGSSPVEKDRTQITFQATIVSVRLVLFHVYFLENVARPDGLTPEQIASSYDALYSYPSAQMQLSLQHACKQIQQVSSWDEFFSRIGLPAPDQDHLAQWFRQAIANSARKGYHQPKRFRSYAFTSLHQPPTSGPGLAPDRISLGTGRGSHTCPRRDSSRSAAEGREAAPNNRLTRAAPYRDRSREKPNKI
jgi:hypothetical protein